MKKNIIFMSFLMFMSCKKELTIEMYNCNNLDGRPEYMFFKNEKDGYIFSTSGKPIPGKIHSEDGPDSKDLAVIYKTNDGGNHWAEVDSQENYKYYNIGTNYKNNIYVLRADSREYFKFDVLNFDLLTEKVKISKNIKPVSAIWSTEKGVYFSTNRDKVKLYLLDTDMKLKDSIHIKNYITDGCYLKNTFFTIASNQGGAYFNRINNKKNKKIDLGINPALLTQQDENHIVIGGSKKENKNEIDLVSYNIDNDKKEIVETFKNYTVIEGLKSNEKVIAGFIGNIKGIFVEYDLFYSLDKGKTWQIQKLQESNGIKPSCLIDNIMYIYSYDGRMQKIIFK